MAPGDGNAPPATREWPQGWTVDVVPETGSTNDDLAAAAAAGARSRTVLVAAHQRAGRGRLDRRWEAPPGANLLVSILVHEPADQPGSAMRRLALAARAACRRLTGVDVDLKWPNDLLVDDGKLAGLLGQRLDDGRVVVGLGLNVRWCPDGAARLGAELDPLEVLAATLAEWDALPQDEAALHDAYRAALATLGQQVHVDLGAERSLAGTAIDVDGAGRLVVIDGEGTRHDIDAGDVIHLRPE